MTGMRSEKKTTMACLFLSIGGAIEPRKTRKCSDIQSLDNQVHDNLKVVLKKPSGFERKRPKHPKWGQKAVMLVQRFGNRYCAKAR